MALKKVVSFKENSEKEVALYNWIDKSTNASGFIKDILYKEYLRQHGNEEITTKKEDNILVDF